MQTPYEAIEYWRFNSFCYYALREEGQDLSLTDLTLEQIENDPVANQHLDRLLQVLQQIGERCNNVKSPGLLRPEGPAWALPPQAGAMRHVWYLKKLEFTTPLPLRLYCYDADQQVLLLFGGGFKTHNDPTHCPNVRGPFRFAQRASKYLDANQGTDWFVQGLYLHTPGAPFYI